MAVTYLKNMPTPALLRNAKSLYDSLIANGKTSEANKFVARLNFIHDNEIILPNERFDIHPHYPGYWFSSEGRIYMKTANKFSEAVCDTDGYKKVSLINEHGGHPKQGVHRLIAEVFIDIPADLKNVPKLIVGHTNTKPHDNRSSNLYWTTTQGRAQTANHAKVKPGNCRSVVGYKIVDKNTTEEGKKFKSVQEAEAYLKAEVQKALDEGFKAEEVPISFTKRISRAIEKHHALAGYYWEYPDVKLYKGEKTATKVINGKTVTASSRGRVWWEGKDPTYGNLTASGYLKVNINGKDFMMHDIILDAFTPRPVKEGEIYQADHINSREPTNNNLSNLRWLTRAENIQAAHNIPIVLTNINTLEKTLYRSMLQAAKAIGSNVGDISNACNGVKGNVVLGFRCELDEV
jgi:hypothetical protein